MDGTAANRRVAEAVRIAMLSRGVSRTGLAEATGIPRVTLIRRLDGHTPFTITELVAVAAHLDIPVTELLAVAA